MAEIKDHFIGIGIFALIILCAITIIINIQYGDPNGNKADAVSNFINESSLKSFNQTINIADKLKNDVNDLRESLGNLIPKLDAATIITLPVAFIQTGWNIIKTIIDSFDFLSIPLTAFSAFLGVPEFVVDIIIVILSMTLIFAAIALIFGKDF